MVEFYQMGPPAAKVSGESEDIIQPPEYILVKVISGTKTPRIDGLPEGLVTIKPELHKCYFKNRKHFYALQFPLTLAYAITDFKCQSKTFNGKVACDLAQPDGLCSAASIYVQLSRVRRLH